MSLCGHGNDPLYIEVQVILCVGGLSISDVIFGWKLEAMQAASLFIVN